jgi:hypothetical protein
MIKLVEDRNTYFEEATRYRNDRLAAESVETQTEFGKSDKANQSEKMGVGNKGA